MGSFLYFAYGSNMLTARLRGRCPSAEPVGVAYANGYSIAFCKEGLDGSGKATIQPDERAGSRVYGVLFQIALAERPMLDRAEGRYRRADAFPVIETATQAQREATTYIAEPEACRIGLVPFDWYLALIRDGAREHDLDAAYVALLTATETCPDLDAHRAAQMAALLQQVGTD